MNIREILEQKTNEELIAITGEDRLKYVDEIVSVAEQILMERHFLFFEPESKNVVELKRKAKKSKKKPKLTGFAFAPFVVGLIVVVLSFVEIPFPNNFSYQDVVIVMVLINITIRILILIWFNIEMNRYNIKYQFIWMVSGLVFGGWALIAFSFVLSYRPIPEDDDKDAAENYYLNDEDNYPDYIEEESDTE